VLGPRAVVRALRQGGSQAEPGNVIRYDPCYVLLPRHVTSPAASGPPGPLSLLHRALVRMDVKFANVSEDTDSKLFEFTDRYFLSCQSVIEVPHAWRYTATVVLCLAPPQAYVPGGERKLTLSLA
jgi:hypothetical protein